MPHMTYGPIKLQLLRRFAFASGLFGLLWSSTGQAQSQEPSPTTDASVTAPARASEPPLAGFHNGLFYLRDKGDVFRFYPSGRLHLDGLVPIGPGLAELGPGQVLAKFEQSRLNYGGSQRRGTDDLLTPSGSIRVNAGTFGVNFWVTRHVRLTANYTLYDFPDSAPVSPSVANSRWQGSNQRAVAPAQALEKGANDGARNDASSLHELAFRAAVQF